MKVKPFAGRATEFRVTEKPGGGLTGVWTCSVLLLLENPGGGPKALEETAVDTGVEGADESSWRAPIFSSEHLRSSFFLLLAPAVALLPPDGIDEADEDWGRGLVELCLPLFFFFFEDFEGDLLSSV